eukprot:scaffold12353_cov65-Phaeocystis_antarctica.AAC.2
MVALVRKGATQQRGLESKLRDLGKIWVSGFGPWEPAAASTRFRGAGCGRRGSRASEACPRVERYRVQYRRAARAYSNWPLK